jgi:hopene-associated glycosyltransferase HpnB
MSQLILQAAGGVGIAVWAYLLLARGAFWRVDTIPALSLTRKRPESPPLRIAAVVPARDEAEVVADSISSLSKNCAPERIHVFLVDDESTDGTADIAAAAATKAGNPGSLTVIRGQAPPPGWTGKLWALQQGVERAAQLAPDYYLFTDADVVLAPEELSALLELMAGGNYDLASLMVRMHCKSLAEKLLIPAFVFFFFQLYPPKWIADQQQNTAGAAGGCILVRPRALERAGGINAIRHEVIDDCALARAVKRSGGKVWLGAAGTSVTVRSYNTFAKIGRMVARTAFNQLCHSTVLLLLTILGMALVYLLPVALLFAGRHLPAVLGLSAWLLMSVAYWPMVRYYRLHPVWALSLPAAALFYAGATVYSALEYWCGRGGQWKGRVQDPSHL